MQCRREQGVNRATILAAPGRGKHGFVRMPLRIGANHRFVIELVPVGILRYRGQWASGGGERMFDAVQRLHVAAQGAADNVRETSENGDVDYLGEFPLESSGAYIFTVKVTPPGHAQPYVVKFNQDYVID